MLVLYIPKSQNLLGPFPPKPSQMWDKSRTLFKCL